MLIDAGMVLTEFDSAIVGDRGYIDPVNVTESCAARQD
jgi:hypothetical protein